MDLSYNWLKQLTKTKKTPKQLADIFSMHTAEVERVTKPIDCLKDLIVAEIIKIAKHPNADKLKIVTVKTVVNKKIKYLK